MTQLVAGLAAVGEDMAQPGEADADLGQDVGRAVAVLDISRMDQGRDQQTAGVGEDVTLASPATMISEFHDRCKPVGTVTHC